RGILRRLRQIVQRRFTNVDPWLDREGHAGLERGPRDAPVRDVHADPGRGAMSCPDLELRTGRIDDEAKPHETSAQDLVTRSLDVPGLSANLRGLFAGLLRRKNNLVNVALLAREL